MDPPHSPMQFPVVGWIALRSSRIEKVRLGRTAASVIDGFVISGAIAKGRSTTPHKLPCGRTSTSTGLSRMLCFRSDPVRWLLKSVCMTGRDPVA